MSASKLNSADVLKNVYFDYIFPLNNLSGDSDDFLRFDCIFRLKDLSGDLDDCLHDFCNFHMHHYIRVYYLYFDFCTYLGYGMLVYFGVYRPTGHSFRNRSGHLHIYSYFGF